MPTVCSQQGKQFKVTGFQRNKSQADVGTCIIGTQKQNKQAKEKKSLFLPNKNVEIRKRHLKK